MLEVFKPKALNYFTFFCPILLTLSASRNPILTLLPLSEFLGYLLCVLITPTPGLAFSLLMPCTLAMSSFLSGRANLFLNFLPLFLCSIPTLIMWGSTSLLTTPPRCHFLMCMPPPPPICSSLTDGRADTFSPSILPSSQNLFILGDFNCHHHLWDSGSTSNLSKEEVFDWVISSDLPLNGPDTPTLLHRSTGSRSSPDISFAPSSVALSCSWVVLEDLGSLHHQFFYLSLWSFVPTSVLLPSIFRKLAGMTLTSTVLL